MPAAANRGVRFMVNGLLMRLQLLEQLARVKFFISNVADVAVGLLNHANQFLRIKCKPKQNDRFALACLASAWTPTGRNSKDSNSALKVMSGSSVTGSSAPGSRW